MQIVTMPSGQLLQIPETGMFPDAVRIVRS